MVVAALIFFLAGGIVAYRRLNIEAYPDPSPPQMEIITQVAGQSAEEIERYITIPIEIAMAGMPGLEHVRSISLYGLSDIKVQFSYSSDYYFAQQQVLNRLNTLQLPNNAQPLLSPESAVGEVYRYQLVGTPGYSLSDLKTLQDWVLERRFRTIPGVIDVVGWGGLTKEYHVDVDLNKLQAYRLTLPQVLSSISSSNVNVGARTLDIVLLLLWQFSIPVLVANLIAWPVAYYYLHHWLEGYAYRISLNPLYFICASAVALVIAWATVIVHAAHVARANPIHALRYE